MGNKITIDYSTDIGMVRLLIRDNKPDDPFFQDDEITAFITQEGTVRCAAAACCEALVAEFASAAKLNMERGNMVIDRTKAASHYQNLARHFRSVEENEPYTEYQELEDETLKWRDGITAHHEHDPQDVPED